MLAEKSYIMYVLSRLYSLTYGIDQEPAPTVIGFVQLHELRPCFGIDYSLVRLHVNLHGMFRVCMLGADVCTLIRLKVPTLEGKPNFLAAIKTLRPFISAERKSKMDEVSPCVATMNILVIVVNHLIMLLLRL